MARRSVLLILSVLLAACGPSGRPTGSGRSPEASPSPRSTDTAVAPSPPGAAATTSSPSQTTRPRGRRGLSILKPRDGDALGTPFEIRYEISGFDVPAQARYLLISMEGIADPIVEEQPLESTSGTVYAGDKRFSGRRDVRFQLAGPDRTPLPDESARVIVRNLSIAGGR